MEQKVTKRHTEKEKGEGASRVGERTWEIGSTVRFRRSFGHTHPTGLRRRRALGGTCGGGPSTRSATRVGSPAGPARQ